MRRRNTADGKYMQSDGKYMQMERKFIPVNPIFINRAPEFNFPKVGEIIEKGGKFIENAFCLMVSDALDAARSVCATNEGPFGNPAFRHGNMEREFIHYNNVNNMFGGRLENSRIIDNEYANRDNIHIDNIRRYMEIPRGYKMSANKLDDMDAGLQWTNRDIRRQLHENMNSEAIETSDVNDMINKHFARRYIAITPRQYPINSVNVANAVDNMVNIDNVVTTANAEDLIQFEQPPLLQPSPQQPPQPLPQQLLPPEMKIMPQPLPQQPLPSADCLQISIRMSAAQTRSITHGDMKDSKIIYVNLLGRDVSVLVRRKSGKKELEFYRGGDSIPADMLNLEEGATKGRKYVGEFGMKVITNEKKSILDILHRMNLLEDSGLSNVSDESQEKTVAAVAFLIPVGVYDKINWSIPEYLLRGKKVWIFSPGNEISGGDAICGHEIYDTFISHT